MKIPDEIQILGSVIKTVYEQQLLEEQEMGGQTNPPFNEIRLRKFIESREIGNDKLFETYFHEVLHTIFNKIGYKEIAKDETFITSMSNALIQIIKQLK